jgi:8-oxo-dGTP diphosphatase
VPRAAVLTGLPRIHVVAGVLRDAAGRVLIAQRLPGRHGAGCWEFPGGKLGPGEAPRAALARELDEELGIRVEAAELLLCLDHDYPDRRVHLEFWQVSRYAGEPQSREQQPLRWVAVAELPAAGLLPADEPLVEVLRRQG